MPFFEFLKAFLIGVVQGITEWLPVSSTGHMILLNSVLKLDVSEAFWDMFLVVIQLGSILAVLVLFWQRLNPFSTKKSAEERRATWSLWFHVVVAIIPSGVIGILFDDWFDAHLHKAIPVAVALVVYGIVFLFLERLPLHRRQTDSANGISYKTAFLIGAFQVLSLIPGTSRSGSTILGAMLLGLSRTAAAEFSFFMAVPTMLGASGIKILKFVLDGEAAVSGGEWAILAIGCVTAFLVSLAAIRYLMDYVKRHSFAAFGVYRIALGILVIGAALMGWIA
ncbi:MAG: undecaprenyl-diphosphate phosphatase [Clostridia bacterium]|nr:undecaprenyl-diphosphate phosphatase [Clostridia bacterium]